MAENMKTIPVDSNDVDLLNKVAKSLDHQVRLLWTPAPSRRQPQVEPTQVTFVAEEECFIGYMLYELGKDRNRRGVIHKIGEDITAAAPERRTPVPVPADD